MGFQYFKGDEIEKKLVSTTDLVFSVQGIALDQYFNEVYNSEVMGGFLYDNNFVPLSVVISRQSFVKSFQEIFESWAKGGTFESYLFVLRKILGGTPNITFTVPNPGHLQINIETSALFVYEFIARVLGESGYENFNMVDGAGNQIVFFSLIAGEGEQDLKSIVFSMSPAGIYVEVSVTIV